MSMLKIPVLGSTKSGKTSLLERLTGNKFPKQYVPSNATEFFNLKAQDKNFNLRDILKNSPPYLLKGAACGIYCLDLSQKADLNAIEEDLNIFKQHNPTAPMILVGTKNDLPRETSQDYFEQLKNKFQFSHSCITSAKTEEDVAHLIRALIEQSQKKVLSVPILDLKSESIPQINLPIDINPVPSSIPMQPQVLDQHITENISNLGVPVLPQSGSVIDPNTKKINQFKSQVEDEIERLEPYKKGSSWWVWLGLCKESDDKIIALQSLITVLENSNISEFQPALQQWVNHNENTMNVQRNLLHAFFCPAHKPTSSILVDTLKETFSM